MSKIKEKEWKELEDDVRSGKMVALEQVYNSCKIEFINFAKKYSIQEQEIIDIYQDSILTLYENISHKKIKSYSATIKTYLFSVGKYKILNHAKSRNRVELDTINESEHFNYQPEMGITFKEKNKLELNTALQLLGDVCKRLLVMSYYQGIKNNELLNHFGYKNDQTLRANKSRCLRKLKEHILKIKKH